MTRRHTISLALAGIIGVGFLVARPDAQGGGAPADVNFSGQWSPIYHEDGPERFPGPDPGDYLGLPLNDAARLRADSYDADRISAIPEYQCRQESPDYALRGNATIRITVDIDPVTQRIGAFHTRQNFMDAERTIYVDDRPHPPANAPHGWNGFSTARWDGNMLIVSTTHLKAFVHRRNGVPSSDQRTLTERWVRHGNILTIISTTVDPAFLTEPIVRSQSWALDPGGAMGSTWCNGAPELPLAEGVVPHYLPGTNPYLREPSTLYGVPYEATRGGASTMYPEYRDTLPQTWSTLAHCGRYCTCMNVSNTCLVTEPQAAPARPAPATPPPPARRP